ncbi:MAG: hypothetical protein ABL900_09980 [Burkholderiaceae bacterium]
MRKDQMGNDAECTQDQTGMDRSSGEVKSIQSTRPRTRWLVWVAISSFALVGVHASESDSQSAASRAREPYERLLPLELSAPATARTGQPLVGISVRLQNPGAQAPNARLRLIIHEKERRPVRRDLNPDNVKVEVQEGGLWKPVALEATDGGVMGAIGSEVVAKHQERHKRGGFAINEGFNKRWPLRVTFGVAGSYTLVVAVSPDNGSRHLAQPAYSNIEVY